MANALISPSNDGVLSRHWPAAAFLFAAAFINMLDTTIINLALPAIQAEFSVSHSDLQWTLVAYVLTFAAGLLPFGRFGDAFGRRQLFLFGLLGFLIASTACGFAPSIGVLIPRAVLSGSDGGDDDATGACNPARKLSGRAEGQGHWPLRYGDGLGGYGGPPDRRLPDFGRSMGAGMAHDFSDKPCPSV